MGIFHLVFSYAGKISLSILADRDIMPDPETYHDFLLSSYEELYRAATGKVLSGQTRAKAKTKTKAGVKTKTRTETKTKAKTTAKARARTPAKAKTQMKIAPKAKARTTKTATRPGARPKRATPSR